MHHLVLMTPISKRGNVYDVNLQNKIQDLITVVLVGQIYLVSFIVYFYLIYFSLYLYLLSIIFLTRNGSTT